MTQNIILIQGKSNTDKEERDHEKEVWKNVKEDIKRLNIANCSLVLSIYIILKNIRNKILLENII